MPFSRKKSCIRCRASKSGCDRSLPSCSRCARRHLKCVYDAPDSDVAAPYPRPRPRTSTPIDLDVEEFSTSHDEVISFGILDSAPGSDSNWPFSISLSESSSDAFSFSKTNPTLLSSSLPQMHLEKTLSMGDSQSKNKNNFFPVPGSSIPAPFTGGCPEDHEHSLPLIPRGHGSTRSSLKRRQILTDCVLSVVVMGQLTSFPKMMIKGDRLPPFIKPPCHSNEELAPRCAIHGSHQCLSKVLAVCAGLVETFYSRTAANAEYVWKLIYGEANRLRKEVDVHISLSLMGPHSLT